MAGPMIYALFHVQPAMAKRASFVPLLELLPYRVIPYRSYWTRLESRSWRAGSRLRGWGIRHYGSTWNWFVPYLHESYLAWHCRQAGRGDILHFMMAEFGSPRYPRCFNRRGAKLLGTFHCSARRLPAVLDRFRCLTAFDRISVMSRSQIPYFTGRGFPEHNIHVTLHGVDTDCFTPAVDREPGKGPLRLLLVGSTERDHEFAAEVLRRVDPSVATLDVLTAKVHHASYSGLPQVTLLPSLNDQELIAAYRGADMLFLPVLDCTANNAILESMACGTPVMSNRTGGIAEYVDTASNYLFDAKDPDVWAAELKRLRESRDELSARRGAVRTWAETLDWRVVKDQYLAFYQAALNDG